MTGPTELPDFALDPLPGSELQDLLAVLHARPGLAPATLLGQAAHLVTRFGDIREFLAAEAVFPGGAMYRVTIEPVVGPTFISMDGERHDHYRRLTTPAFRSRAVSTFVDGELVPLAHEVVDRFAGRGSADLVAELTEVLPFRAISRKLGLPQASETRQAAWSRAMLAYPARPEAACTAAAEVAALVEPVLAERRSDPAEDVLSRLVEAEVNGTQLTDDEIQSHVRLLYAVGATTTADSMSSMLWQVLSDPALVDRAREDPGCRDGIVAESLRCHPAVATLPRMAVHGGTVAGVEVASGALVLLSLAGANRDPEVFVDPDRFDPDRFGPDGTAHDVLTFGFGSKYCPGSHLARRQLRVALDVVLDRLPGLRVVRAAPPRGAILRSVPELAVEWTPC